uniref:THD domain-containing protein n=1 Tax=Scleropages formosus TaxID=113540 RepID=A0A8C9RAT1_SCLFO
TYHFYLYVYDRPWGDLHARVMLFLFSSRAGLQKSSSVTGYLEWERERGDAHLHLFTYEEARRALVVQRSGRYSVYLHVTFLVSEESCSDGAVELQQAVFVWSDSYREDMPLLRARDSVGCGVAAWAKSLYTAGVFSLSAGDRLMVEVSPQKLVGRHEKNLFFGAFFVAPEPGEEEEEEEKICQD